MNSQNETPYSNITAENSPMQKAELLHGAQTMETTKRRNSPHAELHRHLGERLQKIQGAREVTVDLRNPHNFVESREKAMDLVDAAMPKTHGESNRVNRAEAAAVADLVMSMKEHKFNFDSLNKTQKDLLIVYVGNVLSQNEAWRVLYPDFDYTKNDYRNKIIGYIKTPYFQTELYPRFVGKLLGGESFDYDALNKLSGEVNTLTDQYKKLYTVVTREIEGRQIPVPILISEQNIQIKTDELDAFRRGSYSLKQKEASILNDPADSDSVLEFVPGGKKGQEIEQIESSIQDLQNEHSLVMQQYDSAISLLKTTERKYAPKAQNGKRSSWSGSVSIVVPNLEGGSETKTFESMDEFDAFIQGGGVQALENQRARHKNKNESNQKLKHLSESLQSLKKQEQDARDALSKAQAEHTEVLVQLDPSKEGSFMHVLTQKNKQLLQMGEDAQQFEERFVNGLQGVFAETVIEGVIWSSQEVKAYRTEEEEKFRKNLDVTIQTYITQSVGRLERIRGKRATGHASIAELSRCVSSLAEHDNTYIDKNWSRDVGYFMITTMLSSGVPMSPQVRDHLDKLSRLPGGEDAEGKYKDQALREFGSDMMLKMCGYMHAKDNKSLERAMQVNPALARILKASIFPKLVEAAKKDENLSVQVAQKIGVDDLKLLDVETISGLADSQWKQILILILGGLSMTGMGTVAAGFKMS